jgi:polyphosphate kinase
MTLQTPVTQTPFDRRGLARGSRGVGLVTPLEALLAEARDPAAPVLRRLRLVGAIGRHVDGLFQLRASELRGQEAGERGAARRERVRAILAEAHALLAREILPALRARGVRVQRWPESAEAERSALARILRAEVAPLLTPLTVDATHPFPCVASLALSVAVLVREPRGAGERYVGIEVPPAVPRFLTPGPGGPLVAIEDVIGGSLARLLPGLDVVCHHAFRATRDGRPLRSRGLGAGGGPRTRAPVRLEVEAATPPELRRLLAAGLGLDAGSDVDESPGPLDLAAVASLPLARCLAESAPGRAPLRVRPSAREAS